MDVKLLKYWSRSLLYSVIQELSDVWMRTTLILTHNMLVIPGT